MSHSILVLGATGNIGRELLPELKRRKAELVAAVHSPEKKEELESRGYPSIVVDFDDRDSLAKAMKGTDRVFALFPLTEKLETRTRNTVDAAQSSSVRFILRSSGLGASANASFDLGRAHGLADRIVLESGLPSAVIRPNSFMQNFATFWGQAIRHENTIHLPLGEGRSSFVDVRDVALAAAEILLNPSPHRGKSYDLTGPEALGVADVARGIGEVTGRRVVYVPVDEVAAEQTMRGYGMPEWELRQILSLYRIIREGKAAGVSDDLRRLTGREPRHFLAFAKDHRSSWTG